MTSRPSPVVVLAACSEEGFTELQAFHARLQAAPKAIQEPAPVPLDALKTIDYESADVPDSVKAYLRAFDTFTLVGCPDELGGDGLIDPNEAAYHHDLKRELSDLHDDPAAYQKFLLQKVKGFAARFRDNNPGYRLDFVKGQIVPVDDDFARTILTVPDPDHTDETDSLDLSDRWYEEIIDACVYSEEDEDSKSDAIKAMEKECLGRMDWGSEIFADGFWQMRPELRPSLEAFDWVIRNQVFMQSFKHDPDVVGCANEALQAQCGPDASFNSGDTYLPGAGLAFGDCFDLKIATRGLDYGHFEQGEEYDDLALDTALASALSWGREDSQGGHEIVLLVDEGLGWVLTDGEDSDKQWRSLLYRQQGFTEMWEYSFWVQHCSDVIEDKAEGHNLD